MIGKQRTLNRMQKIVLGLICEAMDRAEEVSDIAADGNEGHTVWEQPPQHLQYIGGSGGTGKSWLIETLKEVFAAKGSSKRIVITATSGTAAAGIGGNTIHSALGLAFKDQDGAAMESLPSANLERSRQRWRRRDVLVVDEVSMLGLKTLYEVDHKLRALRGFPHRPFGGIPVVVFTGDFLQFGPVLQKGLLSRVDPSDCGKGLRNLSDRATQYRWQQIQAKTTWELFTNVVILEEQKRAEGDKELIGLLERIRTGRQTAADLDKLNSRYIPDEKLDFTGGRRAIIPLNRHRWDLTLCAALAFGEEHGRKVSLFMSDHQWKTRMPSEEEMEAVVLLGDDAQLPIPGIFPVHGRRRRRRRRGRRTGDPRPAVRLPRAAKRHPSPIAGHGGAFPHIPPGTLMLGTETVQLDKEKHGKYVCPRLAAKREFKMGLTRTGLPCTPGFALTDYKAQSKTLEKVLLGLYGRKGTKGYPSMEKCDVLSLYVQLSQCKRLRDIRLVQPIPREHFEQARMYPELTHRRGRSIKRASKTDG
ncbi:PIF1-like helicase-domain-containing protein [Ilyonectria robusta]|uniref:PIF1-like helicase-domain-containing protein n=1 Tax=Ilyonectria robusta TaxID=1079257 RepID=UPI001E8D4374|nr:PIF1-like helicase-domain-containing protein [Ilyonectria robusta]KAH8659685.1 PIF1-like helicase-domain-containing protein [Ilyonectria robusta]